MTEPLLTPMPWSPTGIASSIRKNRFRGRLLLAPIASVQKTGPYAVQFLLKHPWAAFASTLTNPNSFAAFIPSPKAVAEDSQNRHPVGTGPFVFQQWRTGDRIVLKKNLHYRETGKPYLDRVVIRVIPDHESRYAALVSGQVDAIITDRPVHVEKLRANGNFAEHVLDLRGAGILVLNTSRPPLDDVRVRRAMAHAWNQKQNTFGPVTGICCRLRSTGSAMPFIAGTRATGTRT